MTANLYSGAQTLAKAPVKFRVAAGMIAAGVAVVPSVPKAHLPIEVERESRSATKTVVFDCAGPTVPEPSVLEIKIEQLAPK